MSGVYGTFNFVSAAATVRKEASERAPHPNPSSPHVITTSTSANNWNCSSRTQSELEHACVSRAGKFALHTYQHKHTHTHRRKSACANTTFAGKLIEPKIQISSSSCGVVVVVAGITTQHRHSHTQRQRRRPRSRKTCRSHKPSRLQAPIMAGWRALAPPFAMRSLWLLCTQIHTTQSRPECRMPE